MYYNSQTLKTQFPDIHVDCMSNCAFKITKSASAPKFRVPFLSSIPKTCAGWRLAASKAYSGAQSENHNEMK